MESNINLIEILEKHKKWLNDEEGGERYSCAYVADLRSANLRSANLSGADLSSADLRSADLSSADLSCANLSGCKNLLNPMVFMRDNFEHDDLGWIVYKTFGAYQQLPETWKIEAGSFVEEVCNPLPTNDCGSGVNFATLKWIKNDGCTKVLPVWRCRVRWMDACGIIVPYNTDGKCRCNRLELIELVK
jgi:hypothetical protein